jgi:hypothetical protein
MTHRTLFPPPDENRALEQLERLHREILRARRDRERAGAEFDGFVEELRDRPEAAGAATAAERAARRAPRAVVPSADRGPSADARPEITTTGERPVVPTPIAAPPMKARQAPVSAETIPALAAPRRRSPRMFIAAAAGVLLGAVAAFLWWPGSPQPTIEPQPAPTASAQPSQPAPRPQQPAATPQGQTANPAAAAPVSPSTVQLTTLRAVWMRVTIDGQKILEREVAPGQHLTYTPSSTIVIRAGDAGGVRVKIGNGPEEVLGRDAFPVTRRFTVPQP